MSLFEHHHIDTILLQFFDIDDLKSLYQINKHYRILIYPLLKRFIEFYQKINTFDLPYWINDDKFFNKTIVNGDILICKYFIKKQNIKNINNSFLLCCINGHLEIAIWLHSLDTNYYIDSIYAFQGACENGHLEVAKWLFSFGVNHNAQNDYAFRYACIFGHLELAKWLCSIDSKYHIDIIDSEIDYTIN